MILRFVDKAPINGIRRTGDGYAVAEVPVARTGIQDYAGWEVGRPDLQRVSVYRPAETVFADDYLASMAHKPVTDDHPSESVTADNWDGLAKGWTGETIRKDEAAGMVYVPMMLADSKLIDKLEAGKREVSCGYTCELEWADGETPEGVPFQAIQKNARINHVAVVNRGRAGSACRIGDSWADFKDKEPVVATKTITFDGVPLEATDASEAVINKLVQARDALTAELRDATKELGDEKEARAAEIVAKDAEIANLKKEVADSKVTPEMIRDAAKRLSDAQAKAKALNVEVSDEADEAAIMKAVVDAKMGDAAKEYTADQIALAFSIFSKDAKVEQTDAFRETVKDGVNTKDADAKAQEARQAYIDSLMNPIKQDA